METSLFCLCMTHRNCQYSLNWFVFNCCDSILISIWFIVFVRRNWCGIENWQKLNFSIRFSLSFVALPQLFRFEWSYLLCFHQWQKFCFDFFYSISDRFGFLIADYMRFETKTDWSVSYWRFSRRLARTNNLMRNAPLVAPIVTNF